MRIANCHIESWDDAICPKASPSMGMENRRAVENLTVTNCVLRTNSAISSSARRARAISKTWPSSNYRDAAAGRGQGAPISGISLESVDGSHIQGVVISNITMTGVQVPIFLRLGNRARGLNPKIAGSLEDVSITNVSTRGATVPSSVTGIPGYRVRRVSLDGIHAIQTAASKIRSRLACQRDGRALPGGQYVGSAARLGFVRAPRRRDHGAELRCELDRRRPAIRRYFDDVPISCWMDCNLRRQPALRLWYGLTTSRAR